MKASTEQPHNDDPRKAARAAEREGRTRKVLWCKYAGSAPDLDHAPARLAMVAALALVHSNGSFDATYEELAALCNTSARGARIAATALAAHYYWTITAKRGRRGIFSFTIITQSERERMWDEEKRAWEAECHKWDAAKRQWKLTVDRWLKAESTHIWLDAEATAKDDFTMPIFTAMSNKARSAGVTDPFGLAIYIAERQWENPTRVGLPPDIAEQIANLTDVDVVTLATRLGYHTPPPQCTDCAAELPPERVELGNCVDCAWSAADSSGAETDTSGASSDTSVAETDILDAGFDTSGVTKNAVSCDDQSLSLSRPPKAAKDSQRSLAYAARLDGARYGGLPETTTHQPTPDVGRPTPSARCRHCDPAGWLLGGDPEVPGRAYVGDDGDEEHWIPCRHALASTIAEIEAMIAHFGGTSSLARTDWKEIDRHFGHDDESDMYDAFDELSPERSWECVT